MQKLELKRASRSDAERVVPTTDNSSVTHQTESYSSDHDDRPILNLLTLIVDIVNISAGA